MPTNLRCIDFSATRNEMRRPASRRTSEMSRSGSRNCARSAQSTGGAWTRLIVVGPHDKDDSALAVARNLPGAAAPDLAEEEVNHRAPEYDEEIEE